jgi:hypothetical protein
MWRTEEAEFEAYIAEHHNSARPAIPKQKVPKSVAPVSQLNGGKIAAAWKQRGVKE